MPRIQSDSPAFSGRAVKRGLIQAVGLASVEDLAQACIAGDRDRSRQGVVEAASCGAGGAGLPAESHRHFFLTDEAQLKQVSQ